MLGILVGPSKDWDLPVKYPTKSGRRVKDYLASSYSMDALRLDVDKEEDVDLDRGRACREGKALSSVVEFKASLNADT